MILSVLGNLPAAEGRCPACGEANGCQFDPSGPAVAACWCMDVPLGVEHLRRITQNFGPSVCLCSPCLNAAAGDPGTPAVPGRDYYITSAGTLVFTAAYHLRRGSCCDNACRHCPYR
jgi:hypothetical protein